MPHSCNLNIILGSHPLQFVPFSYNILHLVTQSSLTCGAVGRYKIEEYVGTHQAGNVVFS